MSDNSPRDFPLVMPYADLVHVMFKRAKEAVFGAAESKEIPDDVIEMHRKEFETTRSNLGTTISEIFAKGDTEGWEAVETALHYFISWKRWNNVPLTFTEGMIAGRLSLDGDVNNGGFHQYFFNSSGDHWQNVLQILIEGGDKDGERRFRDLLSIFPNSEPSADRGKRWKELEALERRDKVGMWAHFDKHTDDFYEHRYPTDEAFQAAIKQRASDIAPLWI
jgi:hypothetical protein